MAYLANRVGSPFRREGQKFPEDKRMALVWDALKLSPDIYRRTSVFQERGILWTSHIAMLPWIGGFRANHAMAGAAGDGPGAESLLSSSTWF